ncbi:uncharacterized protein LOC123009770 [Tribolium madens]|uniref:uncharacterized protein LOC123009770 n=1 Tax=Tribolium madens TaxID=41895 RepID=UPI001CF71E35|nr:uncharacterized protein LOC123009770 [Tribolium madens]
MPTKILKFDESKIELEEYDEPSNTPKLAEDLLIAVQKNDTNEIQHLVSQNANILSYEYPVYEYQTILALACNDLHNMNYVTKEVIKILIDLGANYNEPSKNDNWEPLHYTALNANKIKMETILDYLSPKEVNSLVYCSKQITKKYQFCPNVKERESYSNNALNVLLKYGNRNKEFVQCCQLLITRGINVNQTDSNGVSPSDLIWKIHNIELEQLLRDKTNSKIVDNTFGMIKLNQIQRFLSLDMSNEDVNRVDGGDSATSSCTILQLCCAKGLTPCVSRLLEKGANPNKTIPKNPHFPIMIAISGDNKEIVKLLLQKNADLPNNILLHLQTMYRDGKNLASADKYMKMILKHLDRSGGNTVQKYLGCTDELGRTALHYAISCDYRDNILAFLSLGASLVEKDVFGNTPLEAMEPKTLETFFQNNCKVAQNPIGKNNEKFTLTINYKSLMSETSPESDFLYTMTNISHLNYLTNHPVVSIYLTMKWVKFKWLVYFSLFLYFCAYVSLLVYGFTFSGVAQSRDSFLMFSFFLLSFGEVLQGLIFRLHYFKRLDNYINLFLLCGLLYIIASGWLETLNNRNLSVAFSLVFLTSTLGIFMQLGNLSFFTVKVIILQEITITFFKYIAFYSFPLVAFFFCFYMLNDDKNYLFFPMLYETVTMFAGDSDAEYPSHFKRNPIFGHLVYIVFVILIGIILHNLLIGLAVNDLQAIRDEAKFIDKKERSKYITNVENIIFKKLQTSYYFNTMFEKLLNFCRVFDNLDYTLKIYSDSKTFYLEKMGEKSVIRDQNIITFLQNRIKDGSIKSKNTEDSYSLKSLHKKIEELEKLIKSLSPSKTEQ